MISLLRISSQSGRGKYWLLADQVLVSGSSLLTIILAARSLTPNAFGQLGFILLVQLLLLTVQNALITSPYIVLQAEAGRGRGYMSALFVIQLSLTAVLGLLSVLVLLIGHFRRYPVSASWIWILLMLAGYLVQDFLRKIFLTEKKEKNAFVIDALTNIPQVLTLFVLFSAGRLNLNICLTVMAMTFVPSILLGLYWLKPVFPSLYTIRLILREHFRDGKWLLATSLLQWWAGNAFTLACGLFLGATAFGAIRLAQTIFGFINVLLQALENYVLPHSAGIYQRSPLHLSGYLRKISVKAAFVVLPCLLIIALAAKPLFRLAGGDQYVDFHRIIQELSLLYLFIFAGYPVRIAIRVLRLNRAYFIAYLLSSFFTLVAAGPLIRHWGTEGVIAGLLINQLLMLAYWYLVLYKKKFYGNNTYCPGKG